MDHSGGGVLDDQSGIPLDALVKASAKDPNRDADRANEQSASSGHDYGQVRDVRLGRIQNHTGNGGTCQHADATSRVHESDHSRELVRAKGFGQDQRHQGNVTTGKKSIDESKSKVDPEGLGEGPDDQDRTCGHPGAETDHQGLGKAISCITKCDSAKARSAAGETCDQGTVGGGEANEQAVSCWRENKKNTFRIMMTGRNLVTER